MIKALHDAVNLESFEVGGMRYYRIPGCDVLVPSATSVLYKDTEFSVDNQTLERAGRRGSIIHDMIEEYILTETVSKSMPVHTETFHKIKKVIDTRIDEVNYIECPAYSMNLMTAGRIDMIGYFDELPSIIDFKTAKRYKRPEHLTNYIFQTVAYAILALETYDFQVDQIVLIIANDEDSEAQVEIRPITDDLLDAVYDIFVKNRNLEERLIDV